MMPAFGGNGMPQNVCAVVHRIRSVIHTANDGDLVARFAETRDADAFAQLVERHGRMVHAVCRRITRHRQDAEDAFQAAFLVLARKAATVRPPGAVAGWLFGVAVNSAREARKRAARRAVREFPMAAVPETGRCEPDWAFERREAVAEAVAKLPEAYRSLVVACDLQGESQSAAARRLGVPVGTVYSRLSTARRLLAKRLRNRGIDAAASVAILAAFAADAVALPPVSDCPSSRVTELTEAVMKSRFPIPWKPALCSLLAGIAIALGGETPRPLPTPAAVSTRVAAPMPRAADASRLLLGFGGHVRFLKADGSEVDRLTGEQAVKAGADMHLHTATLSVSTNEGFKFKVEDTFGPCGRAAPDGRLPILTQNGLCLLTPGQPPTIAMVKPAGSRTGLFASGETPEIVAWSADGKKAMTRSMRMSWFGDVIYDHLEIDMVAGTTKRPILPKMGKFVDWFADGTLLIIREERSGLREGFRVKKQAIERVSADGKSIETIATCTVDEDPVKPKEWISEAALSPDGKQVACLFTVVNPAKDENSDSPVSLKVVVLAAEKGARAKVLFEKQAVAVPHAVRWSPDGTRIGFLYTLPENAKAESYEWRIGVAQADGSGEKDVIAVKQSDSKTPLAKTTIFDWR